MESKEKPRFCHFCAELPGRERCSLCKAKDTPAESVKPEQEKGEFDVAEYVFSLVQICLNMALTPAGYDDLFTRAFHKGREVERNTRRSATATPTVALKPCPWCNQVPLEIGRGQQSCEKHPRFWVECINPDCSIRPHTNYYHEDYTAAKRWNTRHPDTANVREVLGEVLTEFSYKYNLMGPEYADLEQIIQQQVLKWEK